MQVSQNVKHRSIIKIHLSLQLQDSQATMDIWFIGNAVKEIFEAYDQYYFAITLLVSENLRLHGAYKTRSINYSYSYILMKNGKFIF